MQAFTAALVQFFTAITTFFSAFEKIAKTADNLATVASESSGAYCDEARIQRSIKLKALEAQALLPAPTTSTTSV